MTPDTTERERILSLPAGRELDAAVAEYVMGWASFSFREPWYPSADHNSARKVLAEIGRRGLRAKCAEEVWWKTNAHKMWSQGDSRWALLTASPLDICRAALRAVWANAHLDAPSVNPVE